MLIQIDFSSEVPIYEQLVRQIVIGISRGELVPGELLPSVRQLGEDLGINLHTVNKAYNRLKTLGYVQVDRRSGSTIADSFPPLDIQTEEQLKAEIEYILADWHNRGKSHDELIALMKEIEERRTP